MGQLPGIRWWEVGGWEGLVKLSTLRNTARNHYRCCKQDVCTLTCISSWIRKNIVEWKISYPQTNFCFHQPSLPSPLLFQSSLILPPFLRVLKPHPPHTHTQHSIPMHHHTPPHPYPHPHSHTTKATSTHHHTFLLQDHNLSHSITTMAREDPWDTMNCFKPSTVIP